MRKEWEPANGLGRKGGKEKKWKQEVNVEVKSSLSFEG